MKEQFINSFVSQPWEIEPTRGRVLIASIVQRVRAERPEADRFGDALPKLRIEGDVAIIPIQGTLSMNVPDGVKEWGLGLTDVNDIEEELNQAANDPRVAMIVQVFNSPGGLSLAGQKLFAAVETVQARSGKPVFSYCQDGADLGSAAYHGATPSRMVLTGPWAAAVGCVGTYQPIMDDTEFWKMMGITISVIRSGAHKGMGVDGFSEEQLAFLKSTVDRNGKIFRDHVAKYRLHLAPEEMEGQWYPGDQAAKLGFTHGVAKDLQAAISRFRRQL